MTIRFPVRGIAAALCLLSAGASAAELRLEFLRDAGGTLSFEQARQAPFQPSVEAGYNAGFTHDTYWYRLHLPAGGADPERLLEINYPLLDQIDLYLPEGAGWRHLESGDRLPFSAREVSHRNFVFPLTLAAEAGGVAYLRVQTESSHQFELNLWTPAAFTRHLTIEMSLLGMYYGAMLVMLLYNGFLLISVRDRNYFYYLLNLVAVTGVQVCQNGIGPQFLWGESPWVTHHATPLVIALSILTTAQFSRSFLETHVHTPRFDRLLQAGWWLGVALAVGGFLLPYALIIRADAIAVLLVSATIALASVQVLRQGVRAARFFVLAFGTFLGFVVLKALQTSGLLPTHWLTVYAVQIGSALEVTLLSLALADRINLQRSAQLEARAKSEFLARMSHEIRTPMNAVIGFTELGLRSNSDAKRRDYLEHIRAASRNLLTLINDILDLSKIEAGRLKLETRDFELPLVLDQCRALFAEQAAAKQLAFSIGADADVPARLRGDALRVQQVLVNLIGNALKFTERGSVTVRVERVAEAPAMTLRFSVRDSGIGISAEQRARLFTPFTQADESITRRFGGSGLGLVICKQVVELMGGALGVDSAPGAGSTFRFTARFAAAQDEPVTASGKPATIAGIPVESKPPVSQPAASSAPPSGARILLVEDNLLNQQLMLDLLNGYHLQVEVAGNGREAVSAVEQKTFDLVLMDVQMPEMDGLEATRRIRGQTRHAQLPIVAMTANVMAEDRTRCSEAGMNDFLGKPIDMSEVAAVLARWIKPAESAQTAPAAAPVIDWNATLKRLSGRADLLKRALRDFAARKPSYADEMLQLQAQGKLPDAQHHAHTLKGVAANLGMSRLMEAASHAERSLRANTPLEQGLIAELQAASIEATAAAAKLAEG